MHRVKELREARGLSARALALATGFSHSTIARLEKGERKISSPQAVVLADYFGVSVDYLLGKSADEMFADFVSSVEQNWRTVVFDAAGEPTQVYADDVPHSLQVKFDILRLMNETDDEAVLQSVYEYFRSCIVPRSFVETANEERSYAERLEKVIKTVKLLLAMDSASLDLVLQTAALQKGGN